MTRAHERRKGAAERPSQVRKRELADEQGQELALATKSAHSSESVGDVMVTKIVNPGYRAVDEGIEVSEAMYKLLGELGDKLRQAHSHLSETHLPGDTSGGSSGTKNR